MNLQAEVSGGTLPPFTATSNIILEAGSMWFENKASLCSTALTQ